MTSIAQVLRLSDTGPHIHLIEGWLSSTLVFPPSFPECKLQGLTLSSPSWRFNRPKDQHAPVPQLQVRVITALNLHYTRTSMAVFSTIHSSLVLIPEELDKIRPRLNIHGGSGSYVVIAAIMLPESLICLKHTLQLAYQFYVHQNVRCLLGVCSMPYVPRASRSFQPLIFTKA